VIKPRFLPAAEAELLKEVAYYSNVRDGLGTKFEDAVESAVLNCALVDHNTDSSVRLCRPRYRFTHLMFAK
jgi:hypothetical protein